jgi:poly(A) polymerase/tRNA nucleotidyltransferase (CCA-adding enzyme)
MMRERVDELGAQQEECARIAALVARADVAALRDELIALLLRPWSAAWLRVLDDAGLLTQIIFELEPARNVDQPIVHFLPVLEHSLETVCVVDWLLRALAGTGAVVQPADELPPRVPGVERAIPVAVQRQPGLRYRSAYADALRAHFAAQVGAGYPRSALFKLAALLHDVAKPQTKQPKVGGGVSFHAHQTIGGVIAQQVAQRLRFGAAEIQYIGLIVREHMRPGQLTVLDELSLRAVQRFFHATGDAGPDVLLHALADHMATRGPHLNSAVWYAQVEWTDGLLDTIWGEQPALARPLLDGNTLMHELRIAQGPLVGRVLAAVGEAQAGGDIMTREEALALARRVLARERKT